MTTQERLEIYTAMYLYYYSAARKDLAYKSELYMDEGFCYWLRWELMCGIGLNQLPELLEQKPAKYFVYWFRTGAVYQRLYCLEKAISICEENIRLERIKQINAE